VAPFQSDPVGDVSVGNLVVVETVRIGHGIPEVILCEATPALDVIPVDVILPDTVFSCRFDGSALPFIAGLSGYENNLHPIRPERQADFGKH